MGPLNPDSAQVVPEAGGMVNALREYCDDWTDHLFGAPNHRDDREIRGVGRPVRRRPATCLAHGSRCLKPTATSPAPFWRMDPRHKTVSI
jgi:hypothetical protein